MTEKTRVRLGAYFLFALLLLTLPVTLLVTHYDAVGKTMRWVRDGDSLKYVNVNSTERGVQFLMKRDGISHDAAERIAYRTQRETKTRLTDVEKLPFNTQVDYYEVDGTTTPQSASYKGSAIVLDPKSPQVTAALSYWNNHPEMKKNRDFLDDIARQVKQGYLMAPLSWFGGGDTARNAVKDAGQMKLQQAGTSLYRVAVICTKFPGFRDVAPHSDGDTDANDTGVPYIDYNTHNAYPGNISSGSSGHAIGSYGTTYFAEACNRSFAPPPPGSPAPIPKYNYATTSNGGGDIPGAGAAYNTWDTTWPYCHSILDSVGGVFPESDTGWGIPRGIPTPWDWVYPAVMPRTDPDHSTTGSLQNYMFDLLYDQSTTSQAASNWFYYQTHGFVRPYGDRTDVVGWLYNGHQVNRYDWQTGGGNENFIFPGTPVIRRVMAAGANPGADQIVRTTLTGRGCTILFSRETAMSQTRSTWPTITAYTSADTVEDTGTQPGTITIDWVRSSSAALVMDPYDARRWTITNPGGTSWKFVQFDSTPATPTTTVEGTFAATDNRAWTIAYGAFGTAPNYQRNQNMGCEPLNNTLVTTTDLQIQLSDGSKPSTPLSRPKNRLLSLDYYTHAFLPGASYQIAHMTNQYGRDDDISGTAAGTGVNGNGDKYREYRVYPFDHEGDDPANQGYWAITGEENSGNHRFGFYAGHAGQIMADNGISLTGYDATIHVNADCPNSLNQPRGYVQPISSLYLNENDARLTYFHEMGHALAGLGDLYDMDFVTNKNPPIPNPLFHECPAMDPYSFMAMGGGRIDGYHAAVKGYSPITVITQDTLGVQIPAVEGLLRDPVIIKVPGNPYYIKQNTPVGSWKEYFLLENRNYNSSNSSNGAWTTDSSTRGLYIYHIDSRGPGKWNVAEGGDQRDDNVLAVIVEQADGKYELHYNDKANWGNVQTDAFGANTATRVTRFWQFPMLNGDTNDFGQPVQNVQTAPANSQPVGSPPSWSHGYTYSEYNGGTNLLINGTESDSFLRVVKISNIGDNMTCDVYVEPAEIIATREALTTSLTRDIATATRGGNVVTVDTAPTAHGFRVGETVGISGTDNSTFHGNFEIESAPTATSFTYNQVAANAGANGGTAKTGEVRQGATSVEFMKLTLNNPDGTGANVTDLSKMSIKDVYIDNLYVLESGTSNSPLDLDRAKLYVDNNNNGRIDAGEPLLQSVPLTSSGTWHDYAEFKSLGYRVPLGTTSNLIVAYDIAPEAQINPKISVGVEFTNARRIEPRLPGCVQDRQRNDPNPGANVATDPYSFGPSSFPLVSNTAVIVGYPDRLVITRDNTTMPAKASQGQADVPMLRLDCAVNPAGNPRTGGSVRVDSLQVDQVGTVDAIADILNCKLYLDNGDGSFDATVDGAYTMAALSLASVPTSSFTPVIPATVPASQRAFFPNMNLTIDAAAPKVLFLAVTLDPAADTTKNLQLSLKFGPPETGQPQTACYVQLINNPTEADINKDYVWYDLAVGTDWPLESRVVTINPPNQPPLAPVAPPAFSPSGGQQISNQTPTLIWNAASDPDVPPANPTGTDTPDTLHYEVQIADNVGFTTPTTKITAENTTSWLLTTALTLNQQYWWRVRTIDRQDATSGWSAVQTFTVVSNRPPVVIAGGFAPTGDITTTTPTLTWNKTTDPDTAPANPDTTLRYLLQIDDNSDFTSPVVLTNIGAGVGQAASFGPCPDPTVGGDKNAGLGNADDNTYTVVAGDLLTKATTYYWRVAAVDGANAECAWSATQSFKPTDNRAPNTPVAPFVYSDGAEVTSANPVLSWAMPVPPDPDPTDTLPTIKYDVELKLGDGDLSTGTIIRHTTAIGVRQWAVGTTLTDNGHYYWRVRAVDDQTPTALSSPWSAVQNFWVNTANDAPAAPTTGWDLPNNATTNDTTPTLSWDNSVDPDLDPYDGAYSGAGVVGVSWIVQLTQDPTFATVPYTYPTGPLLAAGRPSVTVTTPLSENPVWWYWQVRAVDNDGAQSPWSTPQRFIVDSTANPPTAPVSGFVPVNAGSVGATTSVTLRWDAGTDTEDAAAALRYEMEIADNAALATAPGYYYASGLSAAGQTYRTLPAAPPLTVGTTYYWHVRTVDTTGRRSAWSTLLSFTVAANQPPNIITTGFYPTGTLEITDPTPDLRWNAATPPDPNADDTADTMGYLVEVDDNPGFVNQEFTTKLLPPHATPAIPTVTVTTTLSVGTRYYWRVRPIDRKGTQAAAWSATQDFRVVVNHAPAAPIAAFSPAAWPPLTTANPTLTWNMPNPADPDVNDTLATLRYEVQLRDQADLASAPYVFTVVTPANTMQAVCTVNLLDNTHYWWRVRSLDAQGLSSDWSAVQNFWINLTNQAPLAPDSGFVPSNGAQVSDDTPTMSWNAAFDADPDDTANTLHYIVELSTTPGFTTVAYQYTSGNGVTTVTPTVALTDLTTWYWRVRTVDNDGAQSPWSVVQNFNLDVGNQVPTLTDPQVVPLYGALGTYYQLYVTYNDAENDPPVWVRCTFANGVGPLDMQKVNPGDSNATDGIQYVVGLPGTQLGLGAHGHAFTCQAGVRLPATPTNFLRGPVIGVQSTVRFTNSAAVDMTQYEEGSTIWLELVDADQNNNPAAPDTVSVTVTAQGGDSEAVLLTETGNATGVFRGSIASLGRAGAVNDGVLNAISGAAGNDIAVAYRDPDDITNPAPDTCSDTARIVDTTAPDTIAGGPAIAAVSGQLGLSSGPNGRTVNLDWSSYAEAAQVDVAGYHVWVSTTQFATTAGLTALATVPAGTQSYTATQLPSGTILAPSTAYWFAVTAFDEVPLEATAVQSRSVTTHDTTPPIISAHNPAPGTTEVGLGTNITFNLNDPGVGIDQSTLVVTLRQNGQVIAHNMPLTVTGNDAALQVSVTPSAPLLWNATVNVGVDVKDHDNNQLVVSDWEFATVTDHVLPTLDEQSPAPNATNVPVSATVSFALHDTGSGINQAATVLIFNGQTIPLASLTFTALPDGVRVTYDPPGDLSYNTPYAVSAQGADVAGNTVGPVLWSFNTVTDGGSVAVDLFDPARGAVDVPIGTNVSFRLSDPLSGVKESTFRLWIAGQEVTGAAELAIVKVPAGSDHPTTMAVSYNPPADFAYATDIAVRIYAEDNVGNVTDLPYSFRTIAAPTYNISGIITDGAATPTPLAGVTVTAGGRTAQTDGNGAYRITGLLAGQYTVTPTRDQYVFTPTPPTVTLGPDDAIANFTGRLLTYSLAGRITEAGTGLAGVLVGCNGLTATTDAQGAYQIAGLANGQYTVTATLANYHFQPPTRAAQVSGANVTGVDFEAVADTFTVEGTITDNTGTRVEGARVECGGKAAVSDAAGHYLITGLRAGSYTVTPTKSGYLMDPLTRNVTVPPSRATQDFTANIEMVSTFPAGVNLIGVPGTPIDRNPMNVFGVNPLQGENCFRWNPAAVPPRYLVAQNDPTAEPIQVKPGRGFFVTFQQARELRVAGVPTSALGTTSIGLYEGWNMIANPRALPVKFSSFVPNIPGGIRSFAFVYDNALGSYLMVSADASLGASRDTILGWEGAWVRATGGGVSLLVSGPSAAATPQAMRPQQAELNGGWMIPVVARAGNRSDVSSVAGVVPGSGTAHTIGNPPTAPDTVDVYFTDTAGARLAHDVRGTAGAQTFTFVVACAVPDASVTVTLPDLSSVPADLQVLLVDQETGKTQYARTMQAYSYRSTGTASERTFELRVSPRTIGSLAMSATAAQARGGNVTLTYTVTKACNVSVKVMNMAGRCIRELVTDRPVAAGVQSELWNLAAASGTRVPSGTYLLQIEAVTETGQRVRGLAQVRVTR